MQDRRDSGEEEEWSEDSAAVGSAEEGEDGEGEESAGDETGGQENIPLFDRPNAGVEEAKPLVRIFIGGVPLSVNERQIRDRFAALPGVRVTDVYIPREEFGNPASDSKCFAYASVDASPEEVERFVSLYAGSKWAGNVVRVEIAKESYRARLEKEWAAASLKAEAKSLAKEKKALASQGQLSAEARAVVLAEAGWAPDGSEAETALSRKQRKREWLEQRKVRSSSPSARGAPVLAGGPPPPRTKWTRRVPHPVLSGHAASLAPY